MDNPINCKTHRRFGVEVELNTTTGIIKKWDVDAGETPDGSDYVSWLIHKATGDKVMIHAWHHTHNNRMWVVKSDRSCGIEVCTPVLKGWSGQKKLLKAIEFFQKAGLSADEKCSLHIHVNVSDLTKRQLATVIAYWIKCEHVFLDAVPDSRKCSRYCQSIGMSDLFRVRTHMDIDDIIERVSGNKYYTLNAYHLQRGGGMSAMTNTRRKTIEFRIAEGKFCNDPWQTKNWLRLVLHFVESAKLLHLPCDYRPNDPWSGLSWLDPEDVFRVLRFDEELSPGLSQVKDWFCDRLLTYGYNTSLDGIWSNEGRRASRDSLLSTIGSSFDQRRKSQESEAVKLYGKKYVL